jgi:tRNA U55 pseudouridine synthase TruB
MGRKMGCGAHLLRLRRIRSGPFTIEQAIPFDRLRGFSGTESLSPWLIPLEEALPSLPEVIGDERLVRKVRFGKKMVVRDLSNQTLPAFEKGQWLKMSSPEEGLVAILRSELKGRDIGLANPEAVVLRPFRLFHPEKHFKMKTTFNLKEGSHGSGSRKEEGDHRAV